MIIPERFDQGPGDLPLSLLLLHGPRFPFSVLLQVLVTLNAHGCRVRVSEAGRLQQEAGGTEAVHD